MEKIEIRSARKEDVSAITYIYNEAIRTSTATFDMVEKTLEDRKRWLAEHGDRYPVTVATIDGRVVGWGSLTPYAERPGWRFTIENAVYVDCNFRGRGVGRMILEHLINAAGRLGYRAIIAQIVEGNEGSVRMHEKCGFETIGVLKKVGNKFDKWLDVILMEKVLSDESR
jgi:phosphinothricin acetyltransferase